MSNRLQWICDLYVMLLWMPIPHTVRLIHLLFFIWIRMMLQMMDVTDTVISGTEFTTSTSK